MQIYVDILFVSLKWNMFCLNLKRRMFERKRYMSHHLSVNCVKNVLNQIIQDSRCFNDLRKFGILKLFKEIVPGFKPPERHTV